MKYLLAPLLAVFLSACSESSLVKEADIADALSTAVVIADGAVETNKVIGVAGDAAAPLVAIGVKVGLREGLPLLGVPEEGADALVDAAGWIGACANTALWLNLAAFPHTLWYGAGCGVASMYHDREVFQ